MKKLKLLLFLLVFSFMFVKVSALVCEDGTYEVIYNANKGKMKVSSECVDNTLTNVKPIRSGYTFLGWSKSKNANEEEYKDGDNIELTSKTTLYAVWSKGIKLTFNANGGKSSKKSKTVYKKLNYGSLPTVSRKGYTFLGWYTKKTGGSIVDEDMIVTSSKNFTIYAHYSKNTYTINYELNGGVNSSKNKKSYTVTTSTFKLYNPTKAGYTFNGWYTSNTYKTKVTKVKKGTTGNKTYYAKWTPNKYNVSYNGNGNTSGKMSNQTNLKYGTIYSLNTNKYVKNGYVFVGWNTKKDGSGTSYDDNDIILNLTTTNKKTIYLYAQWKKPEFNINYVLDGGVNPNNAIYKYSSESTYNLPTPNKDGYIFEGWYLDSNFTTKLNSIIVGSTGDKTLYAKWKKIEEQIIFYTVTYELNGGVNSENAITTFTKDDEVLLLDPTRIGYTFEGWYLDSGFSTRITKINVGTNNNITVYAKWRENEQIEYYNITYILNGGINPSDTLYTYTSSYSYILPIPTRDGYTFDGWYLESEFINKVTTISIGSTEDKIFYAKWNKNQEEIVNYTISYILNGGNELVSPITSYTKNDEITLPIPTRDGYNFEGWYLESDFINNIIKIELGSTGNKVFYAKWSLIEAQLDNYSIIYILNGGVNPNDVVSSYTINDEVILPIPTKEKYTFIGWYTDSEYTNAITKINKGSTTNYTLYAKWKFETKRDYDYVFYTNNDSYTISNINEIKNALYNGLNSGATKIILTCNYDSAQLCFSDYLSVHNDSRLITSISNYVNPYNRFYSIGATMYSGGKGRIEVSINKKYTEEQIEEIDNIIDYNINELNLDEMNDVEKIKWAHDYLVNKNSYDTEFTSNATNPSYSAYGAIVGNKAVCQGYAEAMALFLDRFNIPNLLVASESHIWNLIYLNGEWLHLDATWDDPVTSSGRPLLIYDYYLLTSEQLSAKDSSSSHTYNNTYYLETNFN